MAKSLGGCRWQGCKELLLERFFPPPFSELALIEMKPMLLRSYDHPRPHEPHECNHLICGEAMSIDEICANKTAGPAQSGFAVHRYRSSLDRDDLVGKLDEPPDHGQCGASSIVKDHIQMLDAKSLKVGRTVQFRVQSDNQANVALLEMTQNVLERAGQI